MWTNVKKWESGREEPTQQGSSLFPVPEWGTLTLIWVLDARTRASVVGASCQDSTSGSPGSHWWTGEDHLSPRNMPSKSLPPTKKSVLACFSLLWGCRIQKMGSRYSMGEAAGTRELWACRSLPSASFPHLAWHGGDKQGEELKEELTGSIEWGEGKLKRDMGWI